MSKTNRIILTDGGAPVAAPSSGFGDPDIGEAWNTYVNPITGQITLPYKADLSTIISDRQWVTGVGTYLDYAPGVGLNGRGRLRMWPPESGTFQGDGAYMSVGSFNFDPVSVLTVGLMVYYPDDFEARVSDNDKFIIVNDTLNTARPIYVFHGRNTGQDDIGIGYDAGTFDFSNTLTPPFLIGPNGRSNETFWLSMCFVQNSYVDCRIWTRDGAHSGTQILRDYDIPSGGPWIQVEGIGHFIAPPHIDHTANMFLGIEGIYMVSGIAVLNPPGDFTL